MRAGKLPAEEYRAIEDRAVDEAIRIQEEAGFDVVTDGELRRDIFFGFFVTGMTGLSMVPSETIKFRGPEGPATEIQVPFSVTDKVTARPCPAVDEYKYAAAKTDKQVKITLPSPTLMVECFWNENSRDAYPDPLDLARDAHDAVAQWMREVADAGCTYIQIDAPDLAVMYADAGFRDLYRERGVDPDALLKLGTELVGSLGDIDLPGVTTAMHVCKGNGTQSWLGEGGYEAFSEKVFEQAGGFDVYILEYDDERSGDFEPLAKLPDEKIAVLGLVSTKWIEMEDPDALKARIEDAARFHPKENLGISTQCGFASASETAQDRKITEQTQADKLKLVTDVARDVWG
jgi:5-methyltetrahydropteroyltriglutamate--homocysteine methyltransferase